ncbi:MAG: hypothetical protein GW763_14575 [Paraglaciecola sp.]|nr:hypothetical protein [Paraglaciecola sp.]NCT49176.1 hypothetical protein [Paraglaciecola sp.]
MVKISTLSRAASTVFLFLHLSFDVTATTSQRLSIAEAFQSVFQGQLDLIERSLHTQNIEGLTKEQGQQLQILLLLEQGEHEAAAKQLAGLEKDYVNDASMQFFIGKSWRKVANQGSLWSLSKTIKIGLNALIRAHLLAPDNEHYRAEAASAYTQLGSDNMNIQRQLVAGFTNSSSPIFMIAHMDLAQNNRDYKAMTELAKQALEYAPQSVYAMERAAQAYWTADDPHHAVESFASVCALTPPKGMAYELWQNSCYLAGYIANKENQNYASGIKALKTLVSLIMVDNHFKVEINELLRSLLNKSE